MSVYLVNTYNLKFVIFLGLFIYLFIYLFVFINSSVYNHHVLLGHEWKTKIMQRFGQSVPGSLTHENLSRVGGHVLGVKNTGPMPLIFMFVGKVSEPGMGYDWTFLVSLTNFVHRIQN